MSERGQYAYQWTITFESGIRILYDNPIFSVTLQIAISADE